MSAKGKDLFKLADESLHTEKRLRADPHLQFVQNIGVDAHNYRELANLPSVVKEHQQRHNAYVQQLGIDVLSSMMSEAKEFEIERAKALQKQSKVGTLLRKRVKVTDFADGGIAISIEQDWDTSTWNDNLVEAGCEGLLLVFYDLNEISSLDRKERALQMLQKLLSRHPAAEVFLRKNLEMIIGKATSRLIRNGVSCGVLNLLFVLNGCKDRFTLELSQFKFNGRAVDMLLVEAKLAAVLIQHTFRASIGKKQLLGQSARKAQVAGAVEGFGSAKEAYYRKLRVINSRSSDLRQVWRKMHNTESKHLSRPNSRAARPMSGVTSSVANRILVGGIRGPIHLDAFHVHLALQIICHLVSDVAQGNAHGNREDIVRAQGCIILATFLGCSTSPFSFNAAKILSEVSKVSESFSSMINAGIVQSSFRYMKYARTVHNIGTKIIHRPQARPTTQTAMRTANDNQMLMAFLDCFDIVIHMAQHAAGLYRAHRGYDYVKEAYGTTEQTDYHSLLLHLHRSNAIYNLTDLINKVKNEANNQYKLNYVDNFTTVRPPNVSTAGLPIYSIDKMLEEVTSLLADSYLLQELATIVLEVPQTSLLKRTLLCLLTLLSSHAHYRIVTEITAYGGKLMIKIIHLLAHDDVEISLLALLVFLQMATQTTSRKALMVVHVSKYLLEFQRAIIAKHDAGKYAFLQDRVLERSLLITTALGRQFDWRLYDPQVLQHAICSNPKESVKRQLYLDLLITMKVHRLDEGTKKSQLTKTNSSNTVRGTFQDDIDDLLASVNSNNVHKLTISDWIIMPNNYTLCLQMSQQLSVLAPDILANYFIHPENIYYYESLPLHESVAVCQVLEGLCAYHQTARLIYSKSVVLFLIKFIYLNKFIFLGKEMPAMQIRILLSGIKSAFIALGRLCIAIKESFAPAEEYIHVLKSNDFLINAIFFLDTLSVFNHHIPFNVLQLQKEVGIVVLEYFNKYAQMLNFMQYEKMSQHAKMEDLYDVSKLVVQLLFKLHHTYQVYLTHHPEYKAQLHSEEIHIHDKMCTMLCTVCVHKEAAYVALSDWKVQSALARYMPPPLSGLPNISHGGKFRSFIGASNSNLAHNLITGDAPKKRGSQKSAIRVRNRHSGSNHGSGSSDEGSPKLTKQGTASNIRSSTVRPFARSPTQNLFEADDLGDELNDLVPAHKHYALELLELPASFFELCANLGAISSGLSFCLTSGFLRRALDKLMILHFQLNRAKLIYQKQFLQMVKWDDRKYDFAGCFRLITTMANYHHPEHGCANDLILSTLYEVIAIARDVINLKIKRFEEVILVVYECLAELAKDSFRVSQLIEQYDVLSLIQKELYLLDKLPVRGAKAAINIIHYSCHGLTSAYIVKMIPLLRESLGKVARVFTELDDDIRRAHWTLTKSAMIYKTTVDNTYNVDADEHNALLHVEIEEFIRTGEMKETMSYAAVSSYYSDMAPMKRTQASIASMKSNPLRQSSSFSSAYVNAMGMREDSLDDLIKHPAKKVLYYSAPKKEENSAIGLNADLNGGVPDDGSAHSGSSAIASPTASDYNTPRKGLHLNISTETPKSRKIRQGIMSPAMRRIHSNTSSPGQSARGSGGWQTPTKFDDQTAVMLGKTADMLHHVQDDMGSYSHCGVTSCGSLRFPHVHSNSMGALHEEAGHNGHVSEHGAFSTLTADLADQLSKGLVFPDAEANQIMPMTQLSARDPGLMQLIGMRKGKAGFEEIKKFPTQKDKGKQSTARRSRREPQELEEIILPVLAVDDMPELRFTRPKK